MDSCKENKSISKEAWNFIEYVPDVGEESITDYLVWQWRKLNKKFSYLSVEKHTKLKENTTSGADFELELWILSNGKSLPFVFQAKKLLKQYNAYSGKLNYKNGKKRQVDVLIEYAKEKKLLPFYIMYAQPNKSTEILCDQSLSKPSIQGTGLYITDAFTIDNITKLYRNKKLSKNDILSNCNPFHCLFCCSIMPLNVKKYFQYYFPNIITNELLYDDSEIPEYVNLIANNDVPDPAAIIEQFNLNRIRNIGVIDLRN